MAGCAAALALLGGCKSARPAGLSLEVLESRAATAPLRAEALVGAPDGAAHAEAKGDAAAASTYVESRGIVRVERAWRGNELIERRTLVSGAEGEAQEPTPLTESRYRLEEGALLLAEEINHEEDVEVVFDPPLVVLPATLAPGEAFEQKLSMRVYPMGDRSLARAAGPVTSTVTYEGVERISIPAGEFEAAKVLAVFEARLSLAHVRNTTEEWLAVGSSAGVDTGGTPVPRGITLAERRTEVTRVLLPSTKERLLVLLEAEED